MPEAPLNRITIRGLSSIRDATFHLETPVTVLIGANGAGKSNIIRALELLGEIVDRRLGRHVLTQGGFDRLLHKGTPPAYEVVLEVDAVGLHPHQRNGYRARLTAGQDDTALLEESLLAQDVDRFPQRPNDEPLGVAKESALKGTTGFEAEQVVAALTACRVFHFDDVSHDAPPKRTAAVADNITLARDGANLAAYLLRLSTQDATDYQRIVRTIRAAMPFFDDFVLEPEDAARETVRLRWRQVASDQVFSAGQLSDGTLRFICLATLLLSADRPQTIVLDEPELGLHPFAIHVLAEMLAASARDGRRVVVATQSASLLEEFTAHSVLVVERRAGATQVTRPDPDRLAAFLDEYTLGELWRMNLLGGRPAPELGGAA